MKAFFEKIRYSFARFMSGRNGMDDLARAEWIVVWILLILSLFIRVPIAQMILLILFWVTIIHLYFRVFSWNISKRCAENQVYMNAKNRVAAFFNRQKKQMQQRKVYRFYKCPECAQKVRVPKGHGKIMITCPKCHKEFIKKS